jgi:agmatine deiminase
MTDSNIVYFSGLLPQRQPAFFKRLTALLKDNGVEYGLLPDTNDIWCRDYMPVIRPAGVERAFADVEDAFVLFKYNPSYLQTKKWRPTITDAAKVCQEIGIKPRIYDLVVDGGNIVRFGWKAIMTEQVYLENSKYRKSAVHAMLMDLLNVDELITIPVEPCDPYGHADGCVRFVNKKTVLINEVLWGQEDFCKKLRGVLQKNDLQWIEMPYFNYIDPKHEDSAVGNYINFLEAGDLILVPSYKNYEVTNNRAVDILSQAFGPDKKIIPVESTSVAQEGGVLNCISWGMKEN